MGNSKPHDHDWHDDGVRTDWRWQIKIYRLLMSGPKTNAEIAEALKCTVETARHFTYGMRAVRIIGLKGYRTVVRSLHPIYGLGQDECQKSGAVASKFKPGARMIAFASLIRALQNPSTCADIAEETGIQEQTVNRFVAVARKHRIIHICGWVKRKNAGPPCRIFKIGNGFDARRPAPRGKSILNAESLKRKKQRMMAATLNDALFNLAA